jgi:hypothetical protein
MTFQLGHASGPAGAFPHTYTGFVISSTEQVTDPIFDILFPFLGPPRNYLPGGLHMQIPIPCFSFDRHLASQGCWHSFDNFRPADSEDSPP